MSRFKLDVGTATDMGRHRDHNEDYFATFVPRSETGSAIRGLLLVADGMGGERGGAQASRLAVEQVLEELSADSHRFRSDDATHQELTELVRRVIRDNSDQIFRMGTKDPSARGASSPLVMAAFRSEEALIAQVGDGRCYRVRDGGIECLTRGRAAIGRSVGAPAVAGRAGVEAPAVDVRTETLADRDLFILCSDGLSSVLTEGEILEVSKRFVRPQDLAEALVALAIDHQGSDNATAVVCRCRDAVRLEAEPEETEPIFLPERRRGGTSHRSRWWIAVAVLVFLALIVFGPRYVAIRAFDRGKQHAVSGEYLHARREFATAIRLGLDRRRTDELIDILLRFPSSRAAAPANGEAAGTEGRSAASGPDSEDRDGSGGGR